MNTDELIRSRRTINDFKPEKPPEAVITKAIELARWAPNHRMTEPWRFYLIGPETAEAIVELNTEIVTQKKGAGVGQKKQKKWSEIPGWLMVTMAKSGDALQQQEDYAACSCAIQNLSLSLWEQGVGIKWTTGDVTRAPALYDLTWIDAETETIVGLLWYGYPAEIPESQRKAVDEILVRLP